MKKKQIMDIVALTFVIALIGTSIAYAALRATLTVSGSATISGANWDVHFENLAKVSTVGAPNEIEAKLTDTLFSLKLELIKPLDSVTYTFDVKNGGSIDAKIATEVTPDVSAFTANQLTYQFTYADGTTIKSGDLLKSGESKGLKLLVKFNDADALNANSMSLSLDSSILYVQA